jgi:predicted nucleic acid-binding protein
VRQIVSNTGPILHLHEIGALQLLRDAGDVLVPSAVDHELGGLVSGWASLRPAWLQVIEPATAETQQVQSWLSAGVIHSGEAAALALARQRNADWFLTDDTAARLIGRTMALEVHGSLGVLLWAAAAGYLDSAQAAQLLGQLANSSLWISPRILAEARTALESLFTRET